MSKSVLAQLLLLITITVHAQDPEPGEKKFTFGAGLRAAMPLADLKKSSDFGFGIDVQGEFRFGSFVSGILTSGYTLFPGQSYNSFGKTRYIIPLLAGFRIYPVREVFLGFKMGPSNLGISGEPQVGVNLTNLQFALGYNVIIHTADYFYNHIGLNAIYKFR